MKLKDRYDYKTFDTDPGWEGNIMGEYKGIVEEKNIIAIIKRIDRKNG